MLKYFVIIVVIILAWCPWLSANESMRLIEERAALMKKENPELCAMFPKRETIRKVPFGYTEEVFHDCTLNDEVYGVKKNYSVAFVTFYKGLFNMSGQNSIQNP